MTVHSAIGDRARAERNLAAAGEVARESALLARRGREHRDTAILAAHAAGMGLREIARAVGYDVMTVSRVLRRGEG